MSFQYFAGRSTLRRLQQTVQRNISRQHRLNVRHESCKSHTTRPAQKASAGGGTADNAGKSAEFTGAYWAWLEPIKVPFRTYGAMQKRSPLMTQLDTSLVIYFLGDLCAQSVQSSLFSEEKYEPIRSVRALIIGGLSSIPSYKWFLWLGRNFNYSSHLLSLAVKIVVNQTMFTPLFNTYFFGMQSLLSGSTLPEAWERVKKTVPVSLMNSWKLWPAVTAFSFTYIAPHNRSAFAGCIAVFWQTYLSWLNRAAEVAERESKSIAEAAGVPKVLESAVEV